MKTKFACAYCNKRHEEKDAHVVKEDGGIVVYGVDCMRAFAREIDELTKDEAAATLVLNAHKPLDSFHRLLLERRAGGLKTTARIRRHTEDINLVLVKGGRG